MLVKLLPHIFRGLCKFAKLVIHASCLDRRS